MPLVQIYFITFILPPLPTWLSQSEKQNEGKVTVNENVLNFLLLHWRQTRIIFIIWNIRKIYPPVNDIHSNISFCWNSLIGCTSQNHDFIWNNHLKTKDAQWHVRSFILFIFRGEDPSKNCYGSELIMKEIYQNVWTWNVHLPCWYIQGDF